MTKTPPKVRTWIVTNPAQVYDVQRRFPGVRVCPVATLDDLMVLIPQVYDDIRVRHVYIVPPPHDHAWILADLFALIYWQQDNGKTMMPSDTFGLVFAWVSFTLLPNNDDPHYRHLFDIHEELDDDHP